MSIAELRNASNAYKASNKNVHKRKFTGQHVTVLVLGIGSRYENSTMLNCVLLENFTYNSVAKRVQVAKDSREWKDQDVVPKTAVHFAGDLIKYGVPNSYYDFNPVKPFTIAKLEDTSLTASLAEKATPVVTRYYYNAETVVPCTHNGKSIEIDASAVVETLKAMGLVEIPTPVYRASMAPADVADTSYLPIMGFETGVHILDDEVSLTITHDPGNDNKDRKYRTTAVANKPSNNCFYTSYLASLARKVDNPKKPGEKMLQKISFILFNIRCYSEPLAAFGIETTEPSEAVRWESTIGPALAFYDKLVYIGTPMWKDITKNQVNVQNGNMVRRNDDDDDDFGGAQPTVGFDCVWTLNAFPHLDFREFLRRVGIPLTAARVSEVHNYSNRTASKEYIHAVRTCKNTFDVIPVNGGNPDMKFWFDKNDKEDDETLRSAYGLPPVWDQPELTMDTMKKINAAIRDRTISSGEVLEFFESSKKTGRKKADKFLKLIDTMTKGVNYPVTGFTVYVLRKEKDAVESSVSAFLEKHKIAQVVKRGIAKRLATMQVTDVKAHDESDNEEGEEEEEKDDSEAEEEKVQKRPSKKSRPVSEDEDEEMEEEEEKPKKAKPAKKEVKEEVKPAKKEKKEKVKPSREVSEVSEKKKKKKVVEKEPEPEPEVMEEDEEPEAMEEEEVAPPKKQKKPKKKEVSEEEVQEEEEAEEDE